MKNRLQIKYFMPTKFPYTREQALDYIKNSYQPKNAEGRCTLPAEPIAVFYNDTDDKVTNSNVLLAFGRGGNGTNPIYNEPYFLIDSAKMEKDIADLKPRVDGHDEVIVQFRSDIETLYREITNNKTEINNIWKKIGVKTDGINVDTVYGYINNRYETIVGGKEPHATYPTMIKLAEGIIGIFTRLNEIYNDLDKLVQDLNTERSDRQSADIALDEKFTNKASEFQGKIDTLNVNLNNEINARQLADSAFEFNLNKEIEDRSRETAALDGKIETETLERINQDASLASKIAEEKLRAESAENNLSAEILAEKTRAEASEQGIKENIVSLEERVDTKIDAKVNPLKEKDAELSSEIKALQAADTNFALSLSQTNAAISVEVGTREAKDNELRSLISTNSDEIKKNKVSSKKQTIIVTQPDNTTNIEVNVDNKTIKIDEQTGSLRVSSDALVQYKGENAIKVSGVNGEVKTISLKLNDNEKVLTNEETGLLTNISLNWNNKGVLQLLGKNNTILSEVNMEAFIKDGLIDDVYLDQKDPTYPELVFIFIVNGENKEVRVPVKDLLYVYKAGKGLQLNGDVFDIKLSDSNENRFLTVSSDGLKLSGIETFVNGVKSEVEANFAIADDALRVDYTNKISEVYKQYNPQLEALTEAYVDGDNVLRADFATADANVMNAVTEMIASTNQALEGEIATRSAENESVQRQIEAVVKSLEDETKNRTTADAQHLELAKAYTDTFKTEVDGKLTAETQARTSKDNELENKINEFKTEASNDFATLNGNVGTEGSVKSVIYNSVVGKVVTSISPEDAEQQTLLRKVTVDGSPVIYASNSTDDMTHNGEKLSAVIEQIKGEGQTEAQILLLQAQVKELQAELAYFKSEAFINEIKSSIITSDTFKGVANEISVNVENNSITFGFDDNAIFRADK